MRIRGDLRCYHCGYLAARIEETPGKPEARPQLVPSPAGPGVRREAGRPPRCGRCGGPLFLDEIDVVRWPSPRHVARPEEARRGRPGKAMVPA